MLYRTLGRSGLKTSRLGLGTLNFGVPSWGCDEATSRDLIHAYIDLGGNHIDTADMYSKGVSETIIGRAIKGRRQDIVLASKCGVPLGPNQNRRGGSRYHITASVEESLARLGTDYLDLYYIHVYDPTTPFEESLRALTDMVRAGKIRYLGLSNYTGWEISELAGLSKRDSSLEPIIAVQNEYSMVFRGCEYEVIPSCRYNDIGLVCYSPLGGGILAGVYDPETGKGAKSERYTSGEIIAKKLGGIYMTQRNFDIYREAAAVAEELGTSVATLSMAWLLARPGVDCVLLGPKTMEHLKTGIGADDLAIPEELYRRLNEASLPEYPYPYINQNRVIPEFFGGIERPRDYIEIKETLIPDVLK